MVEFGSEKQKAWAQSLAENLRGAYEHMTAKMITPEADAWKAAADYTAELGRNLANERRAYVIIDTLKGLSNDPEKAAKQLRYWSSHGGNPNANE